MKNIKKFTIAEINLFYALKHAHFKLKIIFLALKIMLFNTNWDVIFTNALKNQLVQLRVLTNCSLLH